MTDPILTKLKEHDKAFKKIDERFEKIDDRFDKIDERFEKVEATQDRIIEKVVQLETDVHDIKEKIVKLNVIDDIMAGQDKMIRILERIDHERVATKSAIDRHGERITHLEQQATLA